MHALSKQTHAQERHEVKHALIHTWSHLCQYLSRSLSISPKAGAIYLSVTALLYKTQLAGDSLQALGKYKIVMRADSVYHVSPQSDRNVPDLSACLCLLLSRCQ